MHGTMALLLMSLVCKDINNNVDDDHLGIACEGLLELPWQLSGAKSEDLNHALFSIIPKEAYKATTKVTNCKIQA